MSESMNAITELERVLGHLRRERRARQPLPPGVLADEFREHVHRGLVSSRYHRLRGVVWQRRNRLGGRWSFTGHE